MREWLEKKPVQVILILVVLLIWGYNTYSIVGAAADEDSLVLPDRQKNMSIENWEVPEMRKNIYKADFPDPFKPKIEPAVVKSIAINPRQPQKEIQPPALTLAGIVESMALIKNRNNQLFFVSVGDTVEGAFVHTVTADSVILSFESQGLTLKINN